MSFYDPFQLVAAARRAPFYARLYKDLPTSGYEWCDVPIATQAVIRDAIYGDCQSLMTCSRSHGMFILSSGSTQSWSAVDKIGRAKTSFWGRDEWHEKVNLVAATHWKNGLLRANDLVLNITPPGYPSNILVHDTINNLPVPCTELALGPHPELTDAGEVFRTIINAGHQFGATAIAGLNSTLVGLAAAVLRIGRPMTSIQRLLGGGELFYGAQLELLMEAFPEAQYAPFGYGATDIGTMGYGELGTDGNTYRIYREGCLFEIVDPVTHDVIREPERVGMVVATSLFRIAMPAIRYSPGDLACWKDDPSGPSPRFSLIGRMDTPTYDFGGIPLSESDVTAVVTLLKSHFRISWLQIVLADSDERPHLRVELSLMDQQPADCDVDRMVRNELSKAVPQLSKLASTPEVSVSVVDFSYFEDLTFTKGRLLVDKQRRRLGNA